MLTSSHKESGEITPSGIGSWFSKITDKEPNDLYPATEAAFYVDLGEPKVAGKEIYYILAISKLGEDKFGIVEKKLKGLNLLYSVKKDKDGYDHLYRILSSWLTSEGRPFAGQGDLMQAITSADMHLYRVAQAEAMHYMDWVKKFAKAYL